MKRQNKKQIISLLLMLALTVGVLPSGIHAASGADDEIESVIEAELARDEHEPAAELNIASEEHIERGSVGYELGNTRRFYPQVGDEISKISYISGDQCVSAKTGVDGVGAYIDVSAYEQGSFVTCFDIQLKNGETLYYELTSNVVRSGELMENYTVDLRCGSSTNPFSDYSKYLLRTLSYGVSAGQINKQYLENTGETRYDLDRDGNYDLAFTIISAAMEGKRDILWTVLDTNSVKGDHTVTMTEKVSLSHAWKVTFRMPEKYGLSVAGVEVTNVNADNILGDDGMTFVYLSDQKTLAVRGSYMTQSEAPIIESHIDGLRIYCDYRSELGNYIGTAMKLYGDTSIEGADLSVLAAMGSAICVYNNASLTVKANVYAEGADHALSGSGKKEKLIISGASLKAKKNSNDAAYGAIDGFRGGVELYGCYFISPEGGRFEKGSALDAQGDAASYVEINTEFKGDVKVGDRLIMGSYNNSPIMWRCAAIDKNGPLMLSEEILCLKAYDAKTSVSFETSSHSRDEDGSRALYGSNLWGDSNLRCWLNSEAAAGNVEWSCGNVPSADNVKDGRNAYNGEAGFLTNFTAAERSVIKKVRQRTVISKPDYNAIPGNIGSAPHTTNDSGGATTGPALSDAIGNYDDAYALNWEDRMFMPDVKQLNAIYDNDALLDDEQFYMGRPSENVWTTLEDDTENEYLSDNAYPYWLRTPLASSGSVMRAMYPDGRTVSDNEEYGLAYDGRIGVRPAFYLDASKAALVGDGSEDSPFTVHKKVQDADPTPVPTDAPKPTAAPTKPPLATQSPEPSAVPAVGNVSYININEKGTAGAWKTAAELPMNTTMQLTTKLTTEVAGQEPRYNRIEWESKDEDVATVDNSGLVTAHNPGTVRINVTLYQTRKYQGMRTGNVPYDYYKEEAVSDCITLKVNKTDDYITAESIELELDYEGEINASLPPMQLKTIITPANANYKRIEYKTDNSNIATVDQNGVVTFNQPGMARITAKLIGYPEVCESSLVFNVKSKRRYIYSYGYSFVNKRSNFDYPDDYRIPLARYEAAGCNRIYAELLSLLKWGGNCAGMSVSSALFYLGYLDAKYYQKYPHLCQGTLPYDLNAPTGKAVEGKWWEAQLRTMIELFQCAQFSFYDATDANLLTTYYGSDVYEGHELRKMADYLNQGLPVVMFVWTDRIAQAGTKFHAILLYDYEYRDDRYIFKVYDCSRHIDLIEFVKNSEGEWNSKMTYNEGEKNEWYPQNFVNYSDIMAAYNYLMGKLETKQYLHTASQNATADDKLLMTSNSGDLTIVNAAGETTSITGGKITSAEIEGVSFMPGNAFEDDDEEVYILKLPNDEYRITNTGIMSAELAIANTRNAVKTEVAPGNSVQITPELHDITATGTDNFEYRIAFTELDNVFDELELNGRAEGTVSAVLDGSSAKVTGANDVTATVSVSGSEVHVDAYELGGDEVEVYASDHGTTGITKDGELVGIEQTLPERMQTTMPTGNLPSGEYSSAQVLTFEDMDYDTTIYYTTDGSDPTEYSEVYSMPIVVNKSMSVRAVAKKSGYTQSDEVRFDYELPRLVKPTVDIKGDLYTRTQSVELSGESTILYTTNGTDPALYGEEYTAKLNIGEDTVLRAVCVDENNVVSEELREEYYFDREYDFELSAKLTDENGEYMSDPDSATGIEVSVRNCSGKETEADVFAAYYDGNGKCIGIKMMKQTVSDDLTSLNMDIPCTEINSIRVYLWDEDMRPLAAEYEF